MKTKLFLLLNFTIFFTAKISAQIMMIGVRGGVNFANEKYDNLPDGETISPRTFLLGGAQFDYRLTNSMEISVQVLYDQKGAHARMGSSFNGMNTADWTISYLEYPILIKVPFGNSSVRPYIFGGPSIGFLIINTEKLHTLTATSIPNGIGVVRSKDTVANITDSTSKFDLSLIAGAGISVTLCSGLELFLDAGYAFGLVNIDNYSWDKGKNYYVYSRDIRIAAGILFPIY